MMKTTMKQVRELSFLDFLRDHHKTMTGLFRQFETEPVRMPNAPDLKEKLVNEIYSEIEIHARMEKDLLYPVLEKIAGKPVRLESMGVLEDVESVIVTLKRSNPHGMDFDERFGGMIEDFEFHMVAEESELKTLSHSRPEPFRDLGRKMQHFQQSQAKWRPETKRKRA